MKLFISCSKDFYGKVQQYKDALEAMGHQVTPPNGWNDPDSEGLIQRVGEEEYTDWKASMLRMNATLVAQNQGILVLNLPKGSADSYIGGATFLEMYKAFELGLPIYLLHSLSKGSLTDEIRGFSPTILKDDLTKIEPRSN